MHQTSCQSHPKPSKRKGIAVGTRPAVRPLQAIACFVLVLAGLSGCAAKSLLKLPESVKLSDYSFTSNDTFGVMVRLKEGNKHSLHKPMVSQLAGQAAEMLRQELGVSTSVVDSAQFDTWAADNTTTASTLLRGEKQVAARPHDYFRQAGYRGGLVVTATEFTDTASRNDFDYSLRTKFVLRVLETNDKGEPIAPAVAQLAPPKTVCSRRFRVDKGSPGMSATEGYRLGNPNRCASALVYPMQQHLDELQR